MNLSDRLQKLLQQAEATGDKIEKQLYVAAAISGAFEERGVPAVLVGGAVVEYYTAGGYSTADIDMILPPVKRQEVEAVMRGLGFERFEDYRHWLHPHIQIPVEFPPGPLQIGHLLIRGVNEIIIGKTKLKILKLEDILIDRLIMAHEWKDLQAQAQAEMLMYAHYPEIDWSDAHQKASRVGLLKLFQQIQRKVKKRMKNR